MPKLCCRCHLVPPTKNSGYCSPCWKQYRIEHPQKRYPYKPRKAIKPMCYKCGIRPNLGYSVWCRECKNNYLNKWLKLNPKVITPSLRQELNARRYVCTLVHRGHFRKLPCAVCGSKKVEAHHYLGYSKEHALDVVWLCPLHHDHVEKGIVLLSSIDIPKNLLIRNRPTVHERFWKFVKRTCHPKGCWEWTGSRNREGYGNFYTGQRGKMSMAHRFSWEIYNGKRIPKRKKILHWCDNPPCVHPLHLRLGTQKQNVWDMESKGRARHIGRKKSVDNTCNVK